MPPPPHMAEAFRCADLRMRMSRSACATYHDRYNGADPGPIKRPCTGCEIGLSHRKGVAHEKAPAIAPIVPAAPPPPLVALRKPARVQQKAPVVHEPPARVQKAADSFKAAPAEPSSVTPVVAPATATSAPSGGSPRRQVAPAPGPRSAPTPVVGKGEPMPASGRPAAVPAPVPRPAVVPPAPAPSADHPPPGSRAARSAIEREKAAPRRSERRQDAPSGQASGRIDPEHKLKSGRPRMPDDVARINRLAFAVSKGELDSYHAAADAAATTLSDWVRRTLAAGLQAAAGPAPPAPSRATCSTVTVRGAMALLPAGGSLGEGWFFFGPLKPTEDARKECVDITGEPPLAVHVFEVAVPVVLSAALVPETERQSRPRPVVGRGGER